jgi:hypothetical protein
MGAAAALVACSSSSKSGSTPSSPPASSTSHTSTTTSTTNTSGTLSKADFIAQADALCKAVYPKVHPGPEPTSATDYPALAAYAKATLTEFGPFRAKIVALIAQTSDKDQLTANWVALDEADVKAGTPLLQQLVTAIATQNNTKADEVIKQLGAQPDHSETISKYLEGYGLTECAKLEAA